MGELLREGVEEGFHGVLVPLWTEEARDFGRQLLLQCRVCWLPPPLLRGLLRLRRFQHHHLGGQLVGDGLVACLLYPGLSAIQLFLLEGVGGGGFVIGCWRSRTSF